MLIPAKENCLLDDELHVTCKDIFIRHLRETRLCASLPLIQYQVILETL